jgi:NADH-quinone oxidoreductase subunit L
MLTLLLAAVALPLLSAVIIAVVGRGRGRAIGTAAAGAMTLLSLAAVAGWAVSPSPVSAAWEWIRVPGGPSLSLTARADSVTLAMLCLLGLVTTAVHVFSWRYMDHDERPDAYYAALSLFGFAMGGLVLAGDLLTVFLFWELVGLCSYLLIGHYHAKPAAGDAARLAFVANRVGDAGFLIGIALLLSTGLPLTFESLPSAASSASSASPGLLTAAGLCVLLGAAGKSAQFPLNLWLAEAMEGPTPASALMHAATMVAAGVYLAARAFPLLTPEALAVLAHVGLATAVVGGVSACVQVQIKRVLAHSTISQLGLMMLAVGCGSPAAAMLHLLAHGFFKALLFLSAGAVIHAADHEHDVRRLGGLRRRMPGTAAAMLVGCLSMAGLPPLLVSGYWSKEAVLSAAAAWGWQHGNPLIAAVPLLLTAVTAFYLFRLYFLLFEGPPRDAADFAHAGEPAEDRPILLPLAALAALSTAAVIWPGRWLIGPVFGDGHGHGAEGLPALAEWLLPAASVTLALAGAGLAAALHAVGGYDLRIAADEPARPADLFGLDRAYAAVSSAVMRAARGAAWLDAAVIDGAVSAVGAGTRGLADVCARHDRSVVDGVVGAVGRAAWALGDGLRSVQGGGVRGYVGPLASAVAIIAAVAGATTLPVPPAAKAAVAGATAGLGVSLLSAVFLVPGGAAGTVAVTLLSALAAASVAGPGEARTSGAALLMGLALSRLVRWGAATPTASAAAALPGGVGLAAAGLWLGSPWFAVGVAFGAAAELAFLFLPISAATALTAAGAAAVAAQVPSPGLAGAALIGVAGGLAAGSAMVALARAAARPGPQPGAET